MKEGKLSRSGGNWDTVNDVLDLPKKDPRLAVHPNFTNQQLWRIMMKRTNKKLYRYPAKIEELTEINTIHFMSENTPPYCSM